MKEIFGNGRQEDACASGSVCGRENGYGPETVAKIADRVIADREGVSEAEALSLATAPLDALKDGAASITKACASRKFDTCSIINGKSGRCPEDCAWCAQSAHHKANIRVYPLLDTEKLVAAAQFSRQKGIGRFSIVTSGKRLSPSEAARLCESVRELSVRTDISLCLSAGLLSEEELSALHEAGISRYHCNLESAPSYFGTLCTTHTQAEKTATLENARKVGMEICSGGIIGMGETMQQRIELAFVLKGLGVKSVPVNILSPIKGTPLENRPPIPEDEVLRTVALLRFILPDAALRFAGGRVRLSAETAAEAYRIGINASIMGDMLTTAGADIDTDFVRIRAAGYEL